MITQGKVLSEVRRIASQEGADVMVKMLIDGTVKDVHAGKNFPVGLLADGAPLSGKTIDVMVFPPTGDQSSTRYELLGWNNQHDAVKLQLMAVLINGMSKSYLEKIPWEEEINTNLLLQNAAKETLEKIYQQDSHVEVLSEEFSEQETDEDELPF